MKTFNLGVFFDIPTRIHWTFWFVPVWIFGASLGGGIASAIEAVFFVFAIFGCVLLHEFGHALAASKIGIGTRDIVLYPIGGVASLERIPQAPLQEFWIAIAGPIVNVLIASFLGIIIVAFDLSTTSFVSAFLWRLMIANVVLVAFNLIPAFPMDGGRILRSCLAWLLDFQTASRIAVFVGRILSIAAAIVGLLSGNLMLVFVAGFVFLAGQAELAVLERRTERFSVRSDFSRAGANVTSADEGCTVPASLPVDSVLAWLNELKTETCRVSHGGRILGRITKSQLIVASSNGLARSPVGALVQ